MYSGRTEEEALERAARKFNVAKELIKLQQGAEHSSTVFLYTYLCGSIYSSAMQMGIMTLLCCYILVCVTTVTKPVHLHGTNFAPFLLLTRRWYDAETSAILLLLKRAFA